MILIPQRRRSRKFLLLLREPSGLRAGRVDECLRPPRFSAKLRMRRSFSRSGSPARKRAQRRFLWALLAVIP